MTAMRARSTAAATVILLGVVLTACGEDEGTTYAPTIRAADFSTTIDNPYLPMVPGTRMVYEGRTDEGLEHIVVEVLDETKVVDGVRCVVVRDTNTINGEVREDTYDWYAQHEDGSVWYFGEATKELEGGKVTSTEGSWEAGVDGAEPGVVMQAVPKVGSTYRQEYLKGVAEDMADVLSITEVQKVAAGSYDAVVQTKDYTPLEPDLVEHKFYARGVGFIAEETITGGTGRIELIAMEGP